MFCTLGHRKAGGCTTDKLGTFGMQICLPWRTPAVEEGPSLEHVLLAFMRIADYLSWGPGLRQQKPPEEQPAGGRSPAYRSCCSH